MSRAPGHYGAAARPRAHPSRSDIEGAVLKHVRSLALVWLSADMMMIQSAMMPRRGLADDQLVGSGVSCRKLPMQHPRLRLGAACGESTEIVEQGANACSEGAGA